MSNVAPDQDAPGSTPVNRNLLSRRALLGGGIAIAAASAGGVAMAWQRPAPQTRYTVSFTDAEWRRRLTPMQYYVLRQEGTERPFTHRLNSEHRRGAFACAGCALPLFASSTKFDSGTGWPSFYAPLRAAVGTTTDYQLVYPRTEVHCRRCGGHLGHVFDDGPQPTGKRYCINGAALTFTPA